MASHPVPVFILNLDRDTDRMAYMDAHMKSIGMPYERISAIDGLRRVFGSEYDSQLALQRGGHELLAGELGCAASHKYAYEVMLERDLSYAVVLEDDVELPTDFAAIVEREVNRNTKHETWDYLLFDYWEPGIPYIKRWLTSAGVQLSERKKLGVLSYILYFVYTALKACYIVPLSLMEGLRNTYKRKHPGPVRFYRPLYLAGAYLLSRSGAEKLLSLAEPIVYTADKLPNQARIQKGLRFYAYAPLVVRQLKSKFGSSILGVSASEL
jgi:GR25 family glycosyltransferase involved in LPS biosynthesis